MIPETPTGFSVRGDDGGVIIEFDVPGDDPDSWTVYSGPSALSADSQSQGWGPALYPNFLQVESKYRILLPGFTNGVEMWFRISAVNGDGESDPTDAMAATPNEPVSIKERIERVARLTAAGISGIGTVYRWDMRGLRDPLTGLGVNAQSERLSLTPSDAMLIPDDEIADEGGDGNDGTTVKTLPLELHLLIGQQESDDVGSAQLVNTWLMRLEQAIAANPRMVEPVEVGNQETLAIDTRVTATGAPIAEQGQRQCYAAIRFEVTYEHYRADPAAGPGMTHFVE